MPEQQHKNRQSPAKRDHSQDARPEQVQTKISNDEIDDLLDDIDEVLEAHTEEEALAWTQGFVQKGGE